MWNQRTHALTKRIGLWLLAVSLITIPPQLAAQPRGVAFVFFETLRIDIMASFPVQVSAIVSGSLSSGCVTLNSITATRQGNLFTLHADATHSGSEVCPAVVPSFEERVPLEVDGLPAGTYTVIASGLSRDFILDANNHACTLPPPPERLEGTRWLLSRGEIGDAVFTPLAGHEVTLDVMDHQVSGHGGCNGYSGLYASSGNRLTIRIDATTEIACAQDITDVEARYLGLLETALTYTLNGGELVIASPQGALYFVVNTVSSTGRFHLNR